MIQVLIPVYRKTKDIEAAVASVMEQTVKDVEILVGVNEKTDLEMEHLPVQKIYAPVGETPALDEQQIRKALLCAAKGEYVIFLDPMDRFTDPEKLALQIAELSLEKNDDCSVCTHEVLIRTEDQEKTQNGYVRSFKVRVNIYLSESFRFDESSVLMKNVFIDDTEKEMDVYTFSHHLILCRAMKMGKASFIPRIMSEASRPRKSGIEYHIRGMIELCCEQKMNKRWSDDALMRHASDKEYIKGHSEQVTNELKALYLPFVKFMKFKLAQDWIEYATLSPLKKTPMLTQLRFDKLNVKQNQRKADKTKQMLRTMPEDDNVRQQEEDTE